MTVTPPFATSRTAVPSAPMAPATALLGASPIARTDALPPKEQMRGASSCSLPAAPWVPALPPPDAASDRPTVPAFFLCDHGDGKQALLRYATVTADGQSENHFPSDMPEGAVVDYAIRLAVELWGTQGAWQEQATCPIGLNVFVDPVIAPDGHTYERRYLTTWLSNHHRSPKTQEPFLPVGAAAPHTIPVISHARMRAFAAWVRAHEAPADADDPILVAVTGTPAIRSAIPVHMPAPANQAVMVLNLQGAQMPLQALPMAHAWRGFWDDPGWPLHGVFCVTNVVFYGAVLGAAMSHVSVTRSVGCGLTFAAPLVGAMSTLIARYFLNRHRRNLGLPQL